MGNVSSRNGQYPVPPGFMPPVYPGYPQFTTPTTWNPFKRSQMRKREKALREYLYTTPMILQYPGAFAVTQPGQNLVQPGIPQVHSAIPIAPVTANGVTNQMPVSGPIVFPGAGPAAPGAGGAGATTVIPSQMVPMGFQANPDYSAFLDSRDTMAPRRSRRSQRRRRSTRHRQSDNHNRRRSSSQSSGSGSGSESPYSSDYDSAEYSRPHHGHNPLPRPPKDILSSTPFRPILTQLPSAQYNSWGIGGTANMPQPQSHQPTTYSNVRPRRTTRRGLFNRRPRDRDQYPPSSLGAAANHMVPPFIPPTMSMPDAQYAPQQQQGPPPGVGSMTPRHSQQGMPPNSPMMQMPSPSPAPPPQQGQPVIPPGTIIPMPTAAPAGSTPYVGANLGTPRTPRGSQTPGPVPPMQMTMMPSPSSGHIPMPSPMPNGGGGTMPMPSPAIGTPGLGQAQMSMPPPGSVLVNATMTMPSPSMGGGGAGMAPVLKFNGYGEFSGLLYHSPHSVVYEEELYPTALHLFEARKFLDHRPDLADRIRQCEHVEDVTAISAELADFTRRDWGNVALSTMDEVLYLKFRQHSELRSLLLNTFPADLVYVESGDPFWGDGAGSGMNELGKSLMRVRERLRIEGRI